MNETLTIKNVDLKGLEQQRLVLPNIVTYDAILSTMTIEEQYTLKNILNMLNSWSADIYFMMRDLKEMNQ